MWLGGVASFDLSLFRCRLTKRDRTGHGTGWDGIWDGTWDAGHREK